MSNVLHPIFHFLIFILRCAFVDNHALKGSWVNILMRLLFLRANAGWIFKDWKWPEDIFLKCMMVIIKCLNFPPNLKIFLTSHYASHISQYRATQTQIVFMIKFKFSSLCRWCDAYLICMYMKPIDNRSSSWTVEINNKYPI